MLGCNRDRTTADLNLRVSPDFRHDSEEFFSFGRRFEIKVVLADDGLGVSSLESRLAHRPVFTDVHRNKRVPQHIVGEAKFSENAATGVRYVDRNDRKLVQRISP